MVTAKSGVEKKSVLNASGWVGTILHIITDGRKFIAVFTTCVASKAVCLDVSIEKN